MAMIGGGLISANNSSPGFAISIVGSGLLYGALALSLGSAGILGELIYKFGDHSLEKYYKFTVTGEGLTTKKIREH